MTGRGLRIDIEGRQENIPVFSFVRVLRDSIDLFVSLGNNMPADQRVKGEWELVDVSHSSPLAVEISPPAEYEEAGRRIVDTGLEGMKSLERGERPPEYFDREALELAKSIVAVLDNGVARISYRAPWRDKPVTPTQRVAAFVDEIIPRQRYELGSCQGRVETLQMHTRHSFAIWDEVTHARVECQTDADGLEQAHEAWGKRVRVYGRIRYTKEGLPKNIEVENINILPEPHEIDASELPKMNIRGSLSIDQHTRRWWDGDQESSMG